MPTPVKTLTRPWMATAAAAIALAAGMSLAAAPAQANGCITNTPGVSDGTAAHPFLIGTAANLQCMRDNAAYLAAGKYFKQTADIDLSVILDPTSVVGAGRIQELTIGTDGTPFEGNYDGGGKKIIGLQVSASGGSAGLFGKTSGATLSNLTLENASVSTPETGTGPSKRCKLQFTTKIKLSRFSRAAKPMAPSDSTSSISPSPQNTQTLRFSVLAMPRACRYFKKRAW